MSLAGKTLFMSGGSRGIGFAIAKAAAEQGANVAIAAKTAEPHPKLPGTVFTAADELNAAGDGKARARRTSDAGIVPMHDSHPGRQSTVLESRPP